MNPSIDRFATSRLRSILVLLDDDAPGSARIQVAGRLAAEHDCELAGLAPTGTLQLPPGMNSAALAIDAADTARQAALHSAHARIEPFRRLAASAGARAISGQAVEGDTAAVLIHQAACHDVVVVSQPAPDDPLRHGALAMMERVLLNSPRPTLVVPGQGTFPTVGRRVVVAWDDGPSCVRAATDAMPLLKKAERVHLCAWRRTDEGAGIITRLEAIARWFRLHGVEAVPRVELARASIGETLLERATALKADVIVMGTYGHARWLERITGGVTRTALARAGIPLFMSR